MLTACADADAEYEADYNRWCDEEHMGRLLSIPEFLSAGRYGAVKGRPIYRTLCEFEHAAVSEGEPWDRARESNV